MSFIALSKVLVLAVAVSCALGAFSPPFFAMTSWDTPVASAGVRLYGSTPDRSGILELSLDGKQDASSTLPYPWHANVHLLGTVVTAFGSDFAAISTQGGGQVVVFFIRNNGALAYIQSSNASTATWTLGLVGGGPQPAPGTSLGAAMWDASHMSVFYQDTEGIIFESEFKNGTWAAPVDFAVANVGTDINALGTTDTSGLSKFVYLQSVRKMQEWRYSSSTVQWSQTTIAGLPAQSSVANIRLSVSCIANGDPAPCRMWYRPTSSNTTGLRDGFFAPAGAFTPYDALPSLDVAAASDVAAKLQFAGNPNNWQWIVFTGADDGTLQVLPWRASVGWGSPSQIVAAPNKVKGVV